MIKMKKVLALVCALVLMLLPLTAMAATTKYVSTGNSGKLNVRKTPHTYSNNVVIKLENGTKVTVEDYYDGHTWAYISVSVNGKTYKGYAMNRYLSNEKPSAQPAKPSKPSSSSSSSSSTLSFKNFKHVEPTQMSVKPSTPGGFVNLRWGPSKSVSVMAKLYADTQVTVIAKDNAWAQVYDPETGYVGFMMLSFLK